MFEHKMYDWSGIMKLPLYKNNLGKKTSDDSQPSSVPHPSKRKGAIFEIENTIDIQFNYSYVFSHLVPSLLVSWLPMLIILFIVNHTLNHQIEVQKSEVALLKVEVNLLNLEVLLLRNQVSSLNATVKKEINQLSSDGDPPDVYSVIRAKRETTQEISNGFKGIASSERKLPNGNAGRRGKQPSKRHNSVLAQWRRLKRRCLSFNSTKSSGFQAIHLKGAHPEAVVEAGHVGPWFVDTKAVKDSRLSSSFQLREDGESVEVESSGLYFIYAQVYYLTSHALNSFTIKLAPKDTDNSITLAYCSGNTVSTSSTSEVSCFTAAMHTLQVGDRIYVQQREKNRRLIMRSGHSFLGLVRFGNQ
ncbi:hypothetical protein ONE63_007755 [Megalurothrips usitatus]|uniref:THD domain-containing protein n=1 Tax=Megalurothrips usitatus TaxID=439358 RepID=A0AAV7XNN5_9NEOP|nr:hypothetical protein ONE63_007755 [Megalurothrips usitatus]KAJ1527809.1 hypothetical protein ONE63_007755 [Megalurothrips usitatus]